MAPAPADSVPAAPRRLTDPRHRRGARHPPPGHPPPGRPPLGRLGRPPGVARGAGRHFEEDRRWGGGRRACRRPGPAEGLATRRSAAAPVRRVLNPGEPGGPRKARADALNRGIYLLTASHP